MSKPSNNLFFVIWRGEWPLVKTWWIAGMLVGIVINGPGFLLENYFDNLSEIGAFFGLLYILLVYAYVVYINVAVWRSATNYSIQKKKKEKSTFWGIAAKVSVVAGVARAIGELVKAITS